MPTAVKTLAQFSFLAILVAWLANVAAKGIGVGDAVADVVSVIVFVVVLAGIGALLLFERVLRSDSGEPMTAPLLRPVREPIPRRTRDDVWRRDQGHCARCGSRERLEFDHIVPVSMGGSNTARNVELLCERCNREKGATLGRD